MLLHFLTTDVVLRKEEEFKTEAGIFEIKQDSEFYQNRLWIAENNLSAIAAVTGVGKS